MLITQVYKMQQYKRMLRQRASETQSLLDPVVYFRQSVTPNNFIAHNLNSNAHNEFEFNELNLI